MKKMKEKLKVNKNKRYGLTEGEYKKCQFEILEEDGRTQKIDNCDIKVYAMEEITLGKNEKIENIELMFSDYMIDLCTEEKAKEIYKMLNTKKILSIIIKKGKKNFIQDLPKGKRKKERIGMLISLQFGDIRK